jgi:hypothetical protein
VVQESEAKSNEHVQIGARAGTANLMDVKAAFRPSLADWLHDSHGWFGLVSSNAWTDEQGRV